MVMVGAAGQTILTTVGMLLGWITSIVSVSAPLMGPEGTLRIVCSWCGVTVSDAKSQALVVGRGIRPVAARGRPGYPWHDPSGGRLRNSAIH